MNESRGSGSLFQPALAVLSPSDQEYLIDELTEMLESSGGWPEDYPEIIEACLANRWPPSDEFMRQFHLAADAEFAAEVPLARQHQDAAQPAPVPDDAAAPSSEFAAPADASPEAPAPVDAGGGVSVAALRAATVTDQQGRTSLTESLSDDEVLEWVRRATALEQQAQWLRSVGVTALQQRWSVTDTDAVMKRQGSGRGRRMRRTVRRSEPPSHPLSPQPSRSSRAARVEDEGGFTNSRPDPAVMGEAFAVTETALVNGVGESIARSWLGIGSALVDGTLPHLGWALQRGRVDWAKAREIVNRLDGRRPDVVEKVESAIQPLILLPDPVTGEGAAPQIRTVPGLRERLVSLLLILDPETEEKARIGEREDRRVYTRQVSAHTAELVAVLPIEQVAAIAARLDAAVALARRERDPRPADQVRADLLYDLLAGGHLPCPSPAPPAAPPTAPATESPADPSVTPAAVRPAAGTAPGPVGVNLTLLIPLATMLGLSDDEPGYLDRYGPIAADLARDLARDLAVNGTFRCAATDDEHGTILGLGRGTYTSSYQPGKRLRELIQATWPRCSFPSCTARAVRPTGACDLDHVRPWPEGDTCSCNMTPACRRHHVMKTKGRIAVETSTDPTEPPGTLHWRLPSNRAYITPAGGHPQPPRLIMERSRGWPTAEPGAERGSSPSVAGPEPDEGPPF